MLTSSTLELFVDKATDEKKLRNELIGLDPQFFVKCLLLIDKRKSKKRNTGNVVKKDDIDWDIHVPLPTLSFGSTKQNETAYIVMNPTKHHTEDI